jgi:catalase
MAAADPDFHTGDLYQAMEHGDYSMWTHYVLILPFHDVKIYRYQHYIQCGNERVLTFSG